MSRNGSGTYNLPAGNPVVTGNTISSSWANTTLSDIASALTGSIAADGQTTPTANLVMGTYAHTGVGNATARTMYASAGQVQDSVLTYLTSVAGTNAITASAPIVMTTYVAGQTFRFIAAASNTGATTININSIGLKSITRDGTTALVAGDLVSGGAYQLIYDGTQFQLTNSSNASVQVTSFSAGTTGLTPSTATTGAITLAGTLNVANGGTGLTTLASSRIPYGAGTSALASSSTFVFDGTNLGIGTASIVTNSKLTVAINTTGATVPTDNLVAIADTQDMALGDGGGIRFGGVFTTGGLFNADMTYIKAYKENATSGNYSYAMTFGTRANGSNPAERMRLDSSGNLGLGVTPSAWNTNVKAAQLASGSLYSYSTVDLELTQNCYYNTSNQWIYSTTAPAERYSMYNGQHQRYTAPSGTAGTAITFTQAMTLDASGNLGIGTASPNAKLEIAGTSIDAQLRFTATGVANTVVGFNNSGSTNFVGAVNNTSYLGNAQAYPLVFTVNTAERMRIDTSGNLLVGTTSAGGVGGITVRPAIGGAGTYGRIDINQNQAADGMSFLLNGTQVGRILISTTTSYVTTSDYRLKENVAPMTGALAKIQALKPVTYNWKSDGSDGQGFIAHELAEVVPDCVVGEKDATEEQEYEISPAIPAVLDEEGNEVTPAVEAVMGTRTVPVYQGIDTSFLVATLTAAIQELKAELDITKAKVAALEAK